MANIKTNPPVRNKPDDGLRALLRKHLPQMQWTTVETGGTQAGVPDSEFCYRGVQGWVECKATHGYAVRFSGPFQVGWHLHRARQGGRSFIAVRRRTVAGVRRGAPRDELWLFAGAMAAQLAAGGLRSVQPLGVWQGGPGGWQWGGLLALLLAEPSGAPGAIRGGRGRQGGSRVTEKRAAIARSTMRVIR